MPGKMVSSGVPRVLKMDSSWSMSDVPGNNGRPFTISGRRQQRRCKTFEDYLCKHQQATKPAKIHPTLQRSTGVE